MELFFQKKFIFCILFFLIAFTSYSQVGINTTNPQETLHVNGSFRLEDGSQSAGKVLISDANGTATWSDSSIETIDASLLTSGVDIPTTTTTYIQTGTSITLPQGRFAVNVTMLITHGAVLAPDNSFLWLRSSFSDVNTTSPPLSPDIEGSVLVSGNMAASSRYSLLSGTVIINNTSGANKTYYYIAGSVESNNNSLTVLSFGGNVWGENSIIAYRIID